MLPSKVEIVEVGPRDGLQNEKQIIPVDKKIELIQRLSECGLSCIEATSFVSPKWIPQFADAAQTLSKLQKKPQIRYPVLVPNKKGFEAAMAAGAECVAVFTAASESFSRKNTNCSIDESLARIDEVFIEAKKKHIPVRAYISCVIACPYEGPIPPKKTVEIARWLNEKGAYQISLGDTIGVATPRDACRLVEATAKEVPMANLAVHFHDTYGQALANIAACLGLGISSIDSSIAGLGGCPYAKGATGNVSTEEVVYMLNGMGIETGVDLNKLIETGRFVHQILPNHRSSKVYQAITST